MKVLSDGFSPIVKTGISPGSTTFKYPEYRYFNKEPFSLVENLNLAVVILTQV